MTPLAFVDTETTGLDPDRHEVWEVGLILRDEDPDDVEYQWFLPVDLGRADPVALSIGRFHERHPCGDESMVLRKDPGLTRSAKYLGFSGETGGVESGLFAFAREFASLTNGAHLVGAVPSFDDAFLKRLLRANGACPGWHYHLSDVEALAAGWLTGAGDVGNVWQPPWDSEVLSRAVGVQPETFERHTALGDARWARAVYDAVMGTPA